MTTSVATERTAPESAEAPGREGGEERPKTGTSDHADAIITGDRREYNAASEPIPAAAAGRSSTSPLVEQAGENESKAEARARRRQQRRQRAPIVVPVPEPMSNQVAEAWRHCVPGVAVCTRPRPARWLLGALGLSFAGAGAAYLLLVGDSLRAGDPGALMGGAGVAAFGGALLGGMYGLLGGDRRGNRDRLRPSTFAFDYAAGGAPRLDERHPGEVAFRFAPNYFFPDGAGRLRLFGHVGGLVGRERDVDPRPQYSAPLAEQTGTHPVVLEQNKLSFGVGADIAVPLPYPILRRSAHLGAAELRWRPEAQIRRHTSDGQIVERTMLLPLTIGVRWYLSPRQRFTFYVGPRLDFTALGDENEKLARGAPNIGAVYSEAWYDIDVPILVKPGARAKINGLITVGYVHSRFDAPGINVAGAYGFLGSAYAGWHMRIRPRESPVATQLGFGTWVGSGVTAMFSAGVVLPDLGARR